MSLGFIFPYMYYRQKKFFVDNSTCGTAPFFSTKSIGIGLGLSIVTDIMAEHGGGIEIESEVGKGTAVVLWLSVEQEDEGRGTEDCGLWTMDKGLK